MNDDDVARKRDDDDEDKSREGGEGEGEGGDADRRRERARKHPLRLAILAVLDKHGKEGLTVGQIRELLPDDDDHSLAVIAYHLQALEAAGLIEASGDADGFWALS